MYIIKNAMKNLGRYKVRYLMIGLIMLAIILTTSISIIINSTTNSIIRSYKDQFGAEVSILPDYDKLRESANTPFDRISVKSLVDFGNSSLLHSKEYNGVMYVNSDKKSVDETSDADRDKLSKQEGRNNYPDPENIVLPNVNVVTTTNKNISDEFVNGARKITKGNIYKKKNECLVSEAYAKLNNLKVGDKIKISGVDTDLKLEKELTISGIYADNTKENEGMDVAGVPAMLKRANEILVDFDSFSDSKMLSEYGEIFPTFKLKSPDKLNAFKAEIKAKGLPENYKVTTDEEGYNTIVKPVEGMADITMTFVYVVLALGGIVLAIVFSMAIRERKYEVGVLRAMGMKKISLTFGIITEVFVVTTAALIIGLSVASVSAQPVADRLLSDQIQTLENAQDSPAQQNYGPMIGQSGKEKVEPLSEVKIQLDADSILKIIIIAIALGLISSTISIFYITKYEPMKILSERT